MSSYLLTEVLRPYQVRSRFDPTPRRKRIRVNTKPVGPASATSVLPRACDCNRLLPLRSVGVSYGSTGATPEVLKFASRQNARDEGDPIDQVGHALVAALAQAARVGEENVERAMTVAHKLSIQLRAAEDRINQLEAEVKRLEGRASRAEQWLQTIKNEIEEKLIHQMEANRPELPVLH